MHDLGEDSEAGRERTGMTKMEIGERGNEGSWEIRRGMMNEDGGVRNLTGRDVWGVGGVLLNVQVCVWGDSS